MLHLRRIEADKESTASTQLQSTFAMFSSLDVAKPGMYKAIGVCRLRSGSSEE